MTMNTEINKQVEGYISLFGDISREMHDVLFKLLGEFDFDMFSFSVKEDGIAEFIVDEGEAVRRKLLLHGFSSSLGGNSPREISDLIIEEYENIFDYESSRVSAEKTNGGYSMIFNGKRQGEPDLNGAIEEYDIQFALCFSSAEVVTEVYKCSTLFSQFTKGPWAYLGFISREILYKNTISPENINEKEKAFLPLMNELALISHTVAGCPYASYDKDRGFSELRRYAESYGSTEMITSLAQIEGLYETTSETSFKIINAYTKLQRRLSDKKYETMWREIFDALCKSQKEYPDKVEFMDYKEALYDIREHVDKFFRAAGYSGEYPDYIKTDSVRGIHIKESYGQTFFVGMEKNAVMRVHCNEVLSSDTFTIEFISGTDITKGRVCRDIYDCTFFDKGRRLYDITDYIAFDYDDGGYIKKGELCRILNVVDKRLHCKRISKEERKTIGTRSAWGFFVLAFLLMGGMFAILMTLAMMIFAALAIGIGDSFAAVPDALASVPWWQIFVFCFVGFGGSMAVIEFIARRK